MDKTKLIITGASDDLIELRGCIYDEIGYYGSSEDGPVILRLPDGSKIKVYYGEGGIWRIEVIEPFPYQFTLEKGDVEADTNDILTIEHPFDYLTYFMPRDKGVCGKITLNEVQQKTFDALENALSDESFQDMKNVVKAIIFGVEF